jgi:hypothetical protein
LRFALALVATNVQSAQGLQQKGLQQGMLQLSVPHLVSDADFSHAVESTPPRANKQLFDQLPGEATLHVKLWMPKLHVKLLLGSSAPKGAAPQLKSQTAGAVSALLNS